jgi:hypothetical protein
MMALGRSSSDTSRRRQRPLSAVLSRFSSSSFAIVDEPGRLIPMASMALLIVFAVYMPPHEPLPGQACRSIWTNSSREMLLALIAPTASKTLTTVRSFPFQWPGLMVPP